MYFAKRLLFVCMTLSIITSNLYLGKTIPEYTITHPTDPPGSTNPIELKVSPQNAGPDTVLPQQEKSPGYTIKTDIKPLFPEDFSQPITIHWKIDSSEPTDWSGFEILLQTLEDKKELFKIEVKEDQGEIVLNDLSQTCVDACYLTAVLLFKGEEKAVDHFAIRHAEKFSIAKGGSDFSSSSGRIKVKIGSKALSKDANFFIAEDKTGGRIFEIKALSKDGMEEISKFNESIEISYQLSEDEFEGDESRLSLTYFDEIKREWIFLTSKVDTKNHVITGYSNHLTSFSYDLNSIDK